MSSLRHPIATVLDSEGSALASSAPPPTESEDPFDTLLNLEDTYYAEGYTLGVEEGRKAGLIEGRAFGMQTAFEKFAAMGRMHGRAVVWAGRLPNGPGVQSGHTVTVNEGDDPAKYAGFLPAGQRRDVLKPCERAKMGFKLKPLSDAPRLGKHVRTLWALSEPESLEVANEVEGVADFDDRYKRGVAKMRMVGKIVGEDIGELTRAGAIEPAGLEEEIVGSGSRRSAKSEAGIEDVDILKVRH